MFLLLIISALLGSAPAFADMPNLFDVPLEVKRMDLGVGKNTNPPGKMEVVCNYFPGFMVKDINRNEPDDELFLLPYNSSSQKDSAVRPACQEAALRNEFTFENGYGDYLGVKSHYIFLTSSDDAGGGTHFAIFNTGDRNKIFEDIYFQNINAIDVNGSNLILRYKRVYMANCSVVAASSCWEKIQKETHIKSSTLVKECTTVYSDYVKADAAARCAQNKNDAACLIQATDNINNKEHFQDDPTNLYYDVRVTIGPSMQQIEPAGGTPSCLPRQ